MFPTTGLDGEEFDPKSYRYKMRGLPLAGGWRLFAALHCPMYDLGMVSEIVLHAPSGQGGLLRG